MLYFYNNPCFLPILLGSKYKIFPFHIRKPFFADRNDMIAFHDNIVLIYPLYISEINDKRFMNLQKLLIFHYFFYFFVKGLSYKYALYRFTVIQKNIEHPGSIFYILYFRIWQGYKPFFCFYQIYCILLGIRIG